jgi:hypothetical protein
MTGRDPEGKTSLKFTELSGLEAQLVMLYRNLSENEQETLLAMANQLLIEREPDTASVANPYPKRRAIDKAIQDLSIKKDQGRQTKTK